MQSFNTESDNAATTAGGNRPVIVGAIDNLRPGACIRLELPDGGELAVYNVSGEYYATENFCPHRGAALSDGTLRGHIVECGLHGWQFDVRTGECLTVDERIRTFKVTTEDGLVIVEVA